jgi:DHA1 family bicyclomycin/chloramphenicol resistance-like MFS transporter
VQGTGSETTPGGAASPDPNAPPSTHVLLLLIGMTSIGPLALNILIPALPGIAQTMHTDFQTVQLLLSVYLVGLAVSQLVLGALSDRFGRRPVLIAGIGIAAASSLAAMFAAGIDALVVARTIQAFGASSGMVISRAIIRDLYRRDRAAAMIAWVTMVIMVVPMIVPPLGGFLETSLGWPSIFACMAVFSAVLLVWIVIALPETLQARSSTGGLSAFRNDARALLSDPTFLGYVLCCALSSSLFFAFLGGAPYVLVTQMGKTSFELGLWFTTGALGYMIGNYYAARLSVRMHADRMVAIGVALGLVGSGLAVLLVGLVPQWGPATIFIPQLIIALANGLLLPNAIAGAISVRPQAAGTASGITGSLQMAVGALSAQLVSFVLEGTSTALPLAGYLLVAAFASAASFLGLIRRNGVSRL